MATISANLTVMIRAAEKAARSLVRDFGEAEQLQVSKKGPGDFVSAADKRSEEIIVFELTKARPSFGILAEEGSRKTPEDGEHTFIIDPLDGTMNFLHGLPHWCISIGLQKGKDIIAGVVYDPVKDELFTAEKGSGAFLRNRRLRVSGRQDMSSSLIACGSPKPDKPSIDEFSTQIASVLRHVASVRRFGAAALDLSYVAAGRFEGYWERHIKPWDVAAGLIILKESGGFISDLSGDDDPLNSGYILASNEHLHVPLRKLLIAE